MSDNITAVLVGSRAVMATTEGVWSRPSSDWDYLIKGKSENGDDFKKTLPKEQLEMGVDLIEGGLILDSYQFKDSIANLNEVYTLKVSHSFWRIGGEGRWRKTVREIEELKKAGAVLVEPLYEVAYQQWELREGRKIVNLNQDKEEFFNGGVRRFWVHDSVHASVAHGVRPLFEKILSPGKEVLTSEEKFWRLSHEERVLLAREEAMVLSIERDL